MRLHLFLISLLVCIAGCKPSEQVTANSTKEHGRKKILTGVTITGVKVENFPKYSPSGEKWDPYAPFSTDPDIYVEIKWNDKVIYKSETRDDCKHGTPVPFSVGLPFDIKPFDQDLHISVFDEDGVSSDDNMGYFDIKLTDYRGKKQIKLQSVNEELILLLDIEWNY